MGRKQIFNTLYNGDGLSDADVLALGLPSVPSAIRGIGSTSYAAGTGYVDAKYGFGFVELTFQSLVLAVTDDGSTGSAYAKLLDVLSGVLRTRGTVTNLTGAVTASWTPTTPVMSIGSAAAGANATLTGTEADVVPSTGLTIASNAFPFAVDNLSPVIGLTDSSGGTGAVGGTLGVVASTFSQTAIANNFAVLAAQVDALRTTSAGTYNLNATAAAQAIYLNFACNSDPTTSKTITLTGTIRFTFDVLGDN